MRAARLHHARLAASASPDHQVDPVKSDLDYPPRLQRFAFRNLFPSSLEFHVSSLVAGLLAPPALAAPSAQQLLRGASRRMPQDSVKLVRKGELAKEKR